MVLNGSTAIDFGAALTAAAALDQREEHVESLRGERDGRAVAQEPALGRVQDEGAELE
jgi:hypothetical protein